MQTAAGGAARVGAGQAGEVERGRLAALAAMSVRLGELVLAQLGKQRPTVGMANPSPSPSPNPNPNPSPNPSPNPNPDPNTVGLTRTRGLGA